MPDHDLLTLQVSLQTRLMTDPNAALSEPEWTALGSLDLSDLTELSGQFLADDRPGTVKSKLNLAWAAKNTPNLWELQLHLMATRQLILEYDLPCLNLLTNAHPDTHVRLETFLETLISNIPVRPISGNESMAISVIISCWNNAGHSPDQALLRRLEQLSETAYSGGVDRRGEYFRNPFSSLFNAAIGDRELGVLLLQLGHAHERSGTEQTNLTLKALENTTLRALALAHIPIMVELAPVFAMPFEDALVWSTERRDGLPWQYWNAVNGPLLYRDRDELLHLAFRHGWNSVSPGHAYPPTAARPTKKNPRGNLEIIRAILDFPSPELGDELSKMSTGRLIELLATPEIQGAVEKLRMISSDLDSKLTRIYTRAELRTRFFALNGWPDPEATVQNSGPQISEI